MREIVVHVPHQKKLALNWGSGFQSPRNLRVRLVAPGAGIVLSGRFKAQHSEMLALVIEVMHEAPETKSRIVVRGLAKDRAQVNFHANARLLKGAKRADASIDARALLLSDEARCELQPDLEIDEQEVRATHSTFVGPLDEEEIFYLQSRGVPEEKAKELLIAGFLNIAQHVKLVK